MLRSVECVPGQHYRGGPVLWNQVPTCVMRVSGPGGVERQVWRPGETWGLIHLESIHLIKSKTTSPASPVWDSIEGHCHLKNLRNCHYLCSRKISFSFYKVRDGCMSLVGDHTQVTFLLWRRKRTRGFSSTPVIARRIKKLSRRISFPLFRGKTTHTQNNK